jgi:hypothetical protein
VIVTLAPPLEEVTNTVCGWVVTPVWVLNVSCGGDATNVVVCASAVSMQHSMVAISPKRNNTGPVFFTTYSNKIGIYG